MTRMVADIGGTNARFALVGPDGRPGQAATLIAADYDDIGAVLRAGHDRLGVPCRQAAIAVAGAITEDRVTMVNRGWTFSRAGLVAEFDFDRLVVVNDFEAIAWSLPALGAADLRHLGPALAPVAGAPSAVLGPGTGLGQAGLLVGPDSPMGGQVAVVGEGGHGDFAPQTERQADVWRILHRRFGHVSVERVLSGPGLVNLYQALAELDGAPAPLTAPAAIAAPNAPLPAPAAVDLFIAILGAAAGNLALTLGARGGVFIAGGIAPTLGDRLAGPSFRRAFEDKGRLADYMKAIPTYLITAPMPGLIGLAALLDRRDGTA